MRSGFEAPAKEPAKLCPGSLDGIFDKLEGVQPVSEEITYRTSVEAKQIFVAYFVDPEDEVDPDVDATEEALGNPFYMFELGDAEADDLLNADPEWSAHGSKEARNERAPYASCRSSLSSVGTR